MNHDEKDKDKFIKFIRHTYLLPVSYRLSSDRKIIIIIHASDHIPWVTYMYWNRAVVLAVVNYKQQ